ncbi:hypothetical protein [Streptomyces luteolus]|uniref:Lipoprotein n=1 Tax=Streptomyces luteolus TaxID=3043615 RepID=A0ABT6SRZ2_9ACTN|nr:hypothetical protein [Streptomyces sp. B-S-A12]MDI3418365.1 hypothetical protein [Streptomyces sp. B-S-A12]
MHRTRTAAALLIAMTASAVSGCVSVGGADAPHSRSDASESEPEPAPQARGDAEPRLVTAPAHEALRMMKPDAPRSKDALRRPEQPKRDRAPGAGATQATQPDQPDQPRQQHTGGTNASGPADGSPLRGAPVPPESMLPEADLCGLGERYGRWEPDSPQARICREKYGS